MIQITDKLIAVLVLEDAYNIRVWRHGIGFYHDNYEGETDTNGFYHIHTGLGKWKDTNIIGTITQSGQFDFDCEKYVIWDDWSDDYEAKSKGCFRNYLNFNDNGEVLNYEVKVGTETAPESFFSLLNSKGIFLDQLQNQKVLILEKI